MVLTCLAAVVVVGLGAIFFYLWKTQTAPISSPQLLLAGQEAIFNAANEYEEAQNATRTLNSVINLTSGAWEQAAAHAALNQLNNTTFNGPLDLLQSTVGVQMEDFLGSWEQEWAYALGQLILTFNFNLGTNITSGTLAPYGCTLFLGGFAGGERVGWPSTGLGSPCGNARSGGFNGVYGTIYAGNLEPVYGGNSSNPTVASAPIVIIQAGQLMDVENPCTSGGKRSSDMT